MTTVVRSHSGYDADLHPSATEYNRFASPGSNSSTRENLFRLLHGRGLAAAEESIDRGCCKKVIGNKRGEGPQQLELNIRNRIRIRIHLRTAAAVRESFGRYPRSPR